MHGEDGGEAQYGRAAGCVFRWIGPRVLVVDHEGRAHNLEAAAALAWAGLDQPGTVTEVHRRVLTALDGAGGWTAAGAVAALDLLVDRGLVVRGPSPAGEAR